MRATSDGRLYVATHDFCTEEEPSRIGLFDPARGEITQVLAEDRCITDFAIDDASIVWIQYALDADVHRIRIAPLGGGEPVTLATSRDGDRFHDIEIASGMIHLVSSPDSSTDELLRLPLTGGTLACEYNTRVATSVPLGQDVAYVITGYDDDCMVRRHRDGTFSALSQLPDLTFGLADFVSDGTFVYTAGKTLVHGNAGWDVSVMRIRL